MFALVDCNNFFVSCERIFDLRLRHHPVAVLSNNDGCVISRSNEVKKMGIAMGTPAFQLRTHEREGRLILKSSNFLLYGDISKRIMSILSMYTADLQPYSIDEAFLVLPDGKSPEEYHAIAQQIKNRVMQWTCIPVGIGIAPTRTLAKFANDYAKTSGKGIYKIEANPESLFQRTPVNDIWGIGKRTGAALQKLGIDTVAQLLRYDENFLLRHFSINLLRTVRELKGIPCLDWEGDEPPQSVTVSRSFGTPVTTYQGIEESIAHYCGLLAQKLRREHVKVHGCTIYAIFYPEYGAHPQEGGSRSIQVVFTHPLNTTSDMLQEIHPHIRPLFLPNRRYKKTGIVSFGIVDENSTTDDLFVSPTKPVNDKLYKVMDQLNARMGRGTVFHLSEGVNRQWEMKRDKLSPAYTTAWDQLPIVK